MIEKTIVPRMRATRDIEEAFIEQLSEHGETFATQFLKAVQSAFSHLRLRAAGSPSRLGFELEIPGLRHHAIAGYPYLIVFVERGDAIDIWRVLHIARDLPTWLQPEVDA